MFTHYSKNKTYIIQKQTNKQTNKKTRQCQVLYFKKVADLQASYKKRDFCIVSFYEFYKVFKNTFFVEHLQIVASAN